MTDARFEDADEAPLRLRAETPEDLLALSALAQDAVFPATQMRWNRRQRRFSLLLNRFRWEDRVAAERQGRSYERVQSVLDLADVTGVATQGFAARDPDTVLSLLSIGFEPGPDGTGTVLLTLAGDGAIRLSVECLDATLTDVTRPYAAPSRRVPQHPED
jgi:hypothetical protein